MELPEGVTRIQVERVILVTTKLGTVFKVTEAIITDGELIGQRVSITEPITSVCGKVELLQ